MVLEWFFENTEVMKLVCLLVCFLDNAKVWSKCVFLNAMEISVVFRKCKSYKIGVGFWKCKSYKVIVCFSENVWCMIFRKCRRCESCVWTSAFSLCIIPFLFRIEEVWKKEELPQTFATFAPFAFLIHPFLLNKKRVFKAWLQKRVL